MLYAVFGEYEKAQEETREGLRLDPDNSTGYANLIQGYALLNRLDQAKATYQEAIRREPGNGGPHEMMYGAAFVGRDTAENAVTPGELGDGETGSGGQCPFLSVRHRGVLRPSRQGAGVVAARGLIRHSE